MLRPWRFHGAALLSPRRQAAPPSAAPSIPLCREARPGGPLPPATPQSLLLLEREAPAPRRGLRFERLRRPGGDDPLPDPPPKGEQAHHPCGSVSAASPSGPPEASLRAPPRQPQGGTVPNQSSCPGHAGVMIGCYLVHDGDKASPQAPPSPPVVPGRAPRSRRRQVTLSSLLDRPPLPRRGPLFWSACHSASAFFVCPSRFRPWRTAARRTTGVPCPQMRTGRLAVAVRRPDGPLPVGRPGQDAPDVSVYSTICSAVRPKRRLRVW